MSLFAKNLLLPIAYQANKLLKLRKLTLPFIMVFLFALSSLAQEKKNFHNAPVLNVTGTVMRVGEIDSGVQQWGKQLSLTAYLKPGKYYRAGAGAGITGMQGIANKGLVNVRTIQVPFFFSSQLYYKRFYLRTDIGYNVILQGKQQSQLIPPNGIINKNDYRRMPDSLLSNSPFFRLALGGFWLKDICSFELGYFYNQLGYQHPVYKPLPNMISISLGIYVP